MSAFHTIVCLIAHAPVQAAFESSALSEIDEYQNNDRIPGWDYSVQSNSVISSINENIGRVRGQAWGVSNPITHFRSLVGAEFRFRFVIRRDQVAFDQGLYRFSVEFRSEGRFLHAPAIASPYDLRQPFPPRTFSQMDTRVRLFALNQQGDVTNTLIFFPQTDHFTTQLAPVSPDPNTIVIDTDGPTIENISSRITVSQEINLPNDRFIVFSVTRRVICAATGDYSNCRISGSDGRNRFRVIAENARIQKVLQPDDPCLDVLNP